MSALIISTSGRMLAEAAARAGDSAFVIDLFADRDTVACAKGVIAVDDPHGSLKFTYDNLDTAFSKLRQRLGAQDYIDRLVLGTGFEDQPRLIESCLARLGQLFGEMRYLGNPNIAVALAKEPVHLANLTRSAGLQHPQLRIGQPGQKLKDSGRWLIKQQGGYGGMHIRWSPTTNPDLQPNEYEQEFIDGAQIGVVFASQKIGSQYETEILGLTRNWLHPGPGAPFRWGGVAGDLLVPDPILEFFYTATRTIAQNLKLTGVNGLDCILQHSSFYGIEINPRPTASFELCALACAETSLWSEFYGKGQNSLTPGFQRLKHRLLQPYRPSRARAIVYAEQDLELPDDYTWPEDCSDIPSIDTIIAGSPVCSVMVTGVEVNDTIRKAQQRVRELEAELHQKFVAAKQVAAVSP
ncbi:MAG: ATP-grasp domain-containing protein [Alphaproteobacteria bacterium]|nr:ATP-grasp domain-containing protein [Alphaproteobacteria bacterium]